MMKLTTTQVIVLGALLIIGCLVFGLTAGLVLTQFSPARPAMVIEPDEAALSATETPQPTAIPDLTPAASLSLPTAAPTATPVPTNTRVPTITPGPTKTATHTPAPTATGTQTPIPTATAYPYEVMAHSGEPNCYDYGIAGHVYDEKGLPLDSVELRYGEVEGQEWGRMLTNANGAYIANLYSANDPRAFYTQKLYIYIVEDGQRASPVFKWQTYHLDTCQEDFAIQVKRVEWQKQ